MPSTNSVPGSRTGQACTMNALKLRLAFSSFTDCSWNLGSFQEPVEVLEFFVAESRVVNRGFIVYSMGQFDLFGLRRETLQQRLNSPGFALARAFPKQRGRLFGGALFNQRRIETFLESQPAPCDANRIPGLSGSPAVFIPDRKSTRLNSSHLGISYAVFCLKKKLQFKTRAAQPL